LQNLNSCSWVSDSKKLNFCACLCVYKLKVKKGEAVA
jgi:hypothetical protein